MAKLQNKETRYFVEIDRESLRITRCGFDQKENLDKGRQNDPAIHRLFLTLGQYRKFVDRCADDLDDVMDI